MAPNPIITSRNRPARDKKSERTSKPFSDFTIVFSGLIGLLSLVFASTRLSWANSWILSGAGIQTLLLIHGTVIGTRFLSNLHVQTLLLLLNTAYALSSTSWLFRPVFSVACYTLVLATCLFQYRVVSALMLRMLRILSPRLHFSQDTIAIFDLPALAIDAEVTGLFLVGGVSLTLSELMIQAHGIELVIRLNAQTELCLYLNTVNIRLFESIEMTDVYGTLKVGEDDGLFAHARFDSSGHDNSSTDRKLLQTTKQVLQSTGVDAARIEDVANHTNGDPATNRSLRTGPRRSDNPDARKRYEAALEHIESTSPITVAQRSLEVNSSLKNTGEKEKRQMICSKLRAFPSVSYIPERAVRVSILQTIFPRLRRFLHRMPLLLRLILSPLSYFHPIKIDSISVAGPGDEIKRLLEDYLLQSQQSPDEKHEQAQQELSEWLSDADFCLEITDVTSLAQVPFGPTGLITIYLRGSDLGVYRTSVEAKKTILVSHIGGADATFVIPAFLLPHHEHYLPPKSSHIDDSEANSDATEVIISVHASLPTYFDQSLLDIAAALAKATEIVDLENLFEKESSNDGGGEESQQNENLSVDDNTDSDGKMSKTRRYVKSGLKKGLKMDMVGDKLNDRWIARTVGKLSARLERAQGDFGYTVRREVSLQPYRPAGRTPSKVLP